MRRKSIDAHAAAIVAAHDAVEAATDEFRTQGQGLAAVLSLVDQLKHEREAFLGAVRDYNDEIAEYLLAVASPGTSGQVLVSRMILTSNGVPRQGSTPKPTRESAPVRPGEAGVPHAAAGGLDHQTSNYQPADADALVADGGLYRGLLDLAPPARVQRLSGLLHWDRALPADAGKPTSLADCLRGVSPEQRPALLAAYWQTRECAARYQVLNDQSEQLGALASAVGTMVGQPAMAEAGVRVQAARRAAKAAVIDAQLALLLSQFDLTQAAGRPLDQDVAAAGHAAAGRPLSRGRADTRRSPRAGPTRSTCATKN